MVKKKKSTRKQKAPTKKKSAVAEEFKKIIFGIIILVFIVATIAMIADFVINQKKDNELISEPDKTEIVKPDKETVKNKIKTDISKKVIESAKKKDKWKETSKKIKYEVFDYDVSSTPSKSHVDNPVKVESITIKNGLPLVAIIIDDIGYNRRTARAIAKLDTNITFAVLPFSPHGEELANELHNSGHEIMLHLPMEPVEYPNVDPGPGSLLTDMTPDELIDQLMQDLDSIPYVVGVNNHMGSKLTSVSDKMNQIFTILKKRDLFFIDSITSRKTRGASSAALLQVNFGQRDVFIDNLQESEYIMGQIRQLIKKAKKEGSAIGIAHPYTATAETLEKKMPWIKTKIQLVPASTLTMKLSD